MFESQAEMIYGHVRIPVTGWLRENANAIRRLAME
jgi:hypothetical protein